MKKVKLKVLKTYKDLTLNRTVKKGETITVTEDRAKKIMASKDRLAEIIQIETNPLPKAAQANTKQIKKEVPFYLEASKKETIVSNSKPEPISSRNDFQAPPSPKKKKSDADTKDSGKKD